MNEFVDYKKRDIDLPKGCKNLNDVLQAQERRRILRRAAAFKRQMATHDRSFTGTLSEVGKYLDMVFTSRAWMFTLWIGPLDDRLNLSIHRSEDGSVAASATVRQDSAQELSLRSFFAQRGLDWPVDSGFPSQFFPSVPVDLMVKISPLPSQGPGLTDLIVDLFRDVYGANMETGLNFHSFEAQIAV